MFAATSAMSVCRRKQYKYMPLLSRLTWFYEHIKYLMKIHVLWCCVIYPFQVYIWKTYYSTESRCDNPYILAYNV